MRARREFMLQHAPSTIPDAYIHWSLSKSLSDYEERQAFKQQHQGFELLQQPCNITSKKRLTAEAGHGTYR
jgi:hypothetical protein